MNMARENALIQAGVPLDKPEDYGGWVHDNPCFKDLLKFLHESGLHASL